ncbi:MAG: rhodanese-like domain-containing protein [Bacteroidota bacterium]
MRQLTMNQKLAAMAFVLAFTGLLFGFISPNGMNGTNQKPNFISVIKLAEMIKNRESVQIIDLRSDELYEAFHIPTAELLQPEQAFRGVKPKPALAVFYSGDDPLSRQHWDNLTTDQKQRSAILYGGVHDWYDRLLYPELPIKYGALDSAMYHNVHELSLFYGGQAEFVNDQKVMNYYLQDFSQLPWPKSHRQNGLVRKGC